MRGMLVVVMTVVAVSVIFGALNMSKSLKSRATSNNAVWMNQ